MKYKLKKRMNNLLKKKQIHNLNIKIKYNS